MRSLRIFINYRREDSAGHAGRLYDALAERFGDEQVFMDIDTIAPGVDFYTTIEDAVGSCDVLIALIGRGWLSLAGPDGKRRLDNSNDFVRLEIEAALEKDTRVIPALVQGTAMPRPEDLPEPLVPLARRNAIELSDARWHYDVGKLMASLSDLRRDGGQDSPKEETPAPTEPTGGLRHLAAGWPFRIVVGLLIVLSGIAITLLLSQSGNPEDPASNSDRVDDVESSSNSAGSTAATPGFSKRLELKDGQRDCGFPNQDSHCQFDIETASMSQDDDELRVVVETYAAWSPAQLSTLNALHISFVTNPEVYDVGDRVTPDQILRVAQEEGQLAVRINAGTTKYQPIDASATQLDQWRMEVRIPKDKIRSAGKVLWRVQWNHGKSPETEDDDLNDYVPDWKEGTADWRKYVIASSESGATPSS